MTCKLVTGNYKGLYLACIMQTYGCPLLYGVFLVPFSPEVLKTRIVPYVRYTVMPGFVIDGHIYFRSPYVHWTKSEISYMTNRYRVGVLHITKNILHQYGYLW